MKSFNSFVLNRVSTSVAYKICRPYQIKTIFLYCLDKVLVALWKCG